MASELNRLGTAAFQNTDRCRPELLLLTYGVLVTQLLKDYESIDEVNVALESIGYNIGTRLVDELLSKVDLVSSCSSFKEAMELVAKVGFKLFLGASAELRNWNSELSEVSVFMTYNPIAEFVETKNNGFDSLAYSNIYGGIIRGALEGIKLNVACKIVKDPSKSNIVGTESNYDLVIRVTLSM